MAKIQIRVDQNKSASLDVGLGDETGNNNIKQASPEILFIHPSQKVRKLKVRYRKNHCKSDVYQHEISRSSSSNGVDETLDLPFVYEHETADRILDYKRKRFAAAVRRLNLDLGQDAVNTLRGDMIAMSIPTLGISNEDWEVISSSHTIAGTQRLTLVPYSALPYTYVSVTSEGGTLPVDESFDITPDYTLTNPDPVTNLSVSMLMDKVGVTPLPYAKLTWIPPEDNYGGAAVSVKLNAEASSAYRETMTVSGATARIDGLTPGQSYDFKVESLNVTGELKGLAVESTAKIAGGDSSAPLTPTGLSGGSKFGDLFWTWTNSFSADVLYHEVEVYTGSSGGTLLDRKKYYKDDKPQHIYKRQTGNLTSPLSAWAQVRAVDYSGNVGSFTSPRVIATTGEVERLDAKNNDFSRKWSSERSTAISLSGGGSVTVVQVNNVSLLSGQTAFIDASFTLRANSIPAGNTVNAGYEVRRGTIRLTPVNTTASSLKSDITRGVGAVTVEDSPGQGTYTYSILVYGLTPYNIDCVAANINVSESRR